MSSYPHPSVRKWRKRIKSMQPYRIQKVFGALEVKMDEHYSVDLPTRYPANVFDGMLCGVRVEYERKLAEPWGPRTGVSGKRATPIIKDEIDE